MKKYLLNKDFDIANRCGRVTFFDMIMLSNGYGADASSLSKDEISKSYRFYKVYDKQIDKLVFSSYFLLYLQ